MFGSCLFRANFPGAATANLQVRDFDLALDRLRDPVAASLEDRDTGTKKSVDESSVV